MKRRLPLALVVAVSVSWVFFAAGGQILAASVSQLGEQDFSDGAIVATDSAWLAAQSNESLPTTALYTAPGFISYFHQGLDPGASGILTFSLWNLNSSAPGNQVTEFRLDNIAQPISGFETGEPNSSVKLFQFPVAGSMLANGEVQVLIVLGGPTGNLVGLDFSRIEVVPEPGSTALGGLGLALLIASVRRRK